MSLFCQSSLWSRSGPTGCDVLQYPSVTQSRLYSGSGRGEICVICPLVPPLCSRQWQAWSSGYKQRWPLSASLSYFIKAASLWGKRGQEPVPVNGPTDTGDVLRLRDIAGQLEEEEKASRWSYPSRESKSEIVMVTNRKRQENRESGEFVSTWGDNIPHLSCFVHTLLSGFDAKKHQAAFQKLCLSL